LVGKAHDNLNDTCTLRPVPVCAIGHTLAFYQQLSTTTAWYIGLSFLSLTTNLLASGLILFRIYQAGNQNARASRHVRKRRYRSLLWTYLESGSIYPTVLIICLFLYFADSPFWWLAITIATQIAGIMPTLMVLVILSAGRSLSESTVTTTTDAPEATTRNSRSIELQPRRYRRADQLVTTESVSQLTDLELESGPGFQVYEGLKSDGLIGTSHES
jgi:hypothetical protein